MLQPGRDNSGRTLTRVCSLVGALQAFLRPRALAVPRELRRREFRFLKLCDPRCAALEPDGGVSLANRMLAIIDLPLFSSKPQNSPGSSLLLLARNPDIGY